MAKILIFVRQKLYYGWSVKCDYETIFGSILSGFSFIMSHGGRLTTAPRESAFSLLPLVWIWCKSESQEEGDGWSWQGDRADMMGLPELFFPAWNPLGVVPMVLLAKRGRWVLLKRGSMWQWRIGAGLLMRLFNGAVRCCVSSLMWLELAQHRSTL